MIKLRRTIIFCTLLCSLVNASTAQPITQSQAKLVLQDPLPGQAIIYLVRAPNDPISVAVLIDGAKVATLPSSSYTAVSIAPGPHRLMSSTTNGNEPSIEILVKADERRFYYLSGIQAKSLGAASKVLRLFALTGALIDLTLNRSAITDGTRSFKECEELDAMDLMSTASLKLPD